MNKRIRMSLSALTIIWSIALQCFFANSMSVFFANPFTVLYNFILCPIIVFLLFKKNHGVFLGSAIIVCSVLDILLFFMRFQLLDLFFSASMAIYTFILFFFKNEMIKEWARKLWWIPGAICACSRFYVVYRLLLFRYISSLETFFTSAFAIITVFSLCKWMANPYEKEVDLNETVDVSIEDQLIYCGLLKQIIFIFFFGMIYISVWMYRITGYLNKVSTRRYRSPGVSLICFWLVPFYSFFWWYESAKRVENRGKELGREYHIAGLYTFLSVFFSFIPAILLQNKLNEFSVVSRAKAQSTGSVSATQELTSDTKKTVEELKMFRELLDDGTITPQEYEKKKAEILGLTNDPKMK